MHTTSAQRALFQPPERSPLVRSVEDQLRHLITSGEVGPDTRLPSVRALRELMHVSIPTLRAAIEGLVTLGLVEIRPGIGMFVARRRDERRLLSVSLRRAGTAELAHVLTALDRQATTVAVRRFGPGRRKPRMWTELTLWASEREMSHWQRTEQVVRTDNAFHDAVGRAAGRSGAFGRALRATIARRLHRPLLLAMESVASDRRLDGLHRQLSAEIIDGRAHRAVRLAGAIAERELDALLATLG